LSSSLVYVIPLVITLGACSATDSVPAPESAEVSAGPSGSEASSTERVDFQAELPPAPPSEVGTFVPPPRDSLPDGPFGEAVRRGEAIFTDTPAHAGSFLGNQLSCVNCHLDAGRRADSAPMWAAWVSYPAYRKKNDRVNSMEERIQGCFTYSMNAGASPTGDAPEAADPLITDLSAYFFWLASAAPTGVSLPGRGYPRLAPPPQGWDIERGAQVYADRCAICHGDDGVGQVDSAGAPAFPALWGPQSFNWGAGMHRVNTSAGFIFANMPLGQARTLSEQQAWDVAAYINSQPRPADPRQTGTVEEADERFHQHDCRYGDAGPERQLGERG